MRDHVLTLKYQMITGRAPAVLLRRTRSDDRAYETDLDVFVTPFHSQGPVTVTLRVIGNRVEYIIDSTRMVDTLSPRANRTGGFAIRMPPGSEMIISRATLRVLWPVP